MDRNVFPSIKLQSLIPQHIRMNYPLFYEFLKIFYEAFEEEGAGYEFLSHLQQFGDVDDTTATLLQNHIATYLGKFDQAILSDDPLIRENPINKRTLIKNIRKVYRSVGSEKAFKFMFQLKYSEPVDIYYPWNDVLTPSESNWDRIIAVKLVYNPAIADCVGGSIQSENGLAKGIIESYYAEDAGSFPNNVTCSVVTVKDYDTVGTIRNLAPGMTVTLRDILHENDPITATVISVLTDINFAADADRGMFYESNDDILIEGDGVGARMKVNSVNHGQIDSLRIVNPGRGYQIGDKITAVANDPYGNSFYAEVFRVDEWGGITFIKIYCHGVDFSVSPTVVVSSDTGTGAILVAEGTMLGSIQSIRIQNSGANYDNDPDPAVITFPSKFKIVNPQTSFVAGVSVIGETSGATGDVVSVDMASGILTVENIVGVFLDGETITQREIGNVVASLDSIAGQLRRTANTYSDILIPINTGDDLVFNFTPTSDYNVPLKDVSLVPTDERIYNGVFDTDTGWDKTGGWEIILGVATCDTPGALTYIGETTSGVTAPVDTPMVCSFEVKELVNATIRMDFEGYSVTVTDPGTYTFEVVTPTGVAYTGFDLAFVSAKVDVGDPMLAIIDNVSLKNSTNVIKDGQFIEGSTYWNTNTNWTLTEGKVTCNGGAGALEQQGTPVLIQTATHYEVSFDLGYDDVASGEIVISLGGIDSASIADPGTHTFTVKSGVTTAFAVTPSGGFNGYIANLTIRPTANLIENSTFADGPDAWTFIDDGAASAGWVWDSADKVVCDGTHTIPVSIQKDFVDTDFDPGVVVEVVVEAVVTEGYVFVLLDGIQYPLANGTNTINHICECETTDTLPVEFFAYVGFVGAIDDLTITGTGIAISEGFSTDPTLNDWVITNDGAVAHNWVVVGGLLKSLGGQIDQMSVSQALSGFTEGLVYKATITVDEVIQGTMIFDIEESPFSDLVDIRAAGTYSVTFKADATVTAFIIANSDFIGSVSSLVIEPYDGYLADDLFDQVDTESLLDYWWNDNDEWDLSNVGYAKAVGVSQPLTQTLDTIDGKFYEIVMNISEQTTGKVRPYIDSWSVDLYQFTDVEGAHRVIFLGDGTTVTIGVEVETTFTGKISRFSVIDSENIVEDTKFNAITPNNPWEAGSSNFTFTGGKASCLTASGAVALVQTLAATLIPYAVYRVTLNMVLSEGVGFDVSLGEGPARTVAFSGRQTFDVVCGVGSTIEISGLNVTADITEVSIELSDSIIANGSFDDAYNWTYNNGSWSILNGRANHTLTWTDVLTQNVKVTEYQAYLLTIETGGGNGISAVFCHEYKAIGTPVVGALTEYTGAYKTYKSHINYDKYLQDSYYYQLFSYLITTRHLSENWRHVVDKIHPAGTIGFGIYDSSKLKISESYGGIAAPDKATLDLYKFDNVLRPGFVDETDMTPNISNTQIKDFGNYTVYDIVTRPKRKTTMMPGSYQEIQVGD